MDDTRRDSEVLILLEINGAGSEKATFWFEDVWGEPDTLQGKNPRWDGRERLVFDFEDIKSDMIFELTGTGTGTKAMVLQNGKSDSKCKVELSLVN